MPKLGEAGDKRQIFPAPVCLYANSTASLILSTEKELSSFRQELSSLSPCQMRLPVVGNKIKVLILLTNILSANFLKSNPLSKPPRIIVCTLSPRKSKASMAVSGTVDKESL